MATWTSRRHCGGVLTCVLLVCLLQPGAAQEVRAPRITEHPVSAVVPRHDPVTLSCKADGRPTPSLSWTKDGEPLVLGAHRVPLPGGNLFFLRVEAADAGVYRCVASNSAGQAVSKDANLEVAYLKHDFRAEPASQVVRVGETVLLQCGPPRGRPEPSVDWHKDGVRLKLTDSDPSQRVRLVDTANLAIQDARPADSGQYRCVASNAAGTRETNEAMLTVVVPPRLVVGPKDATVLVGASATLRCEVAGDPKPDVLWRRAPKDAVNATGKTTVVVRGHVLRIDGARASDAGQYVCEADNGAGRISASASVTVVSEPTLSPTPPALLRVEPGTTATVRCGAQGVPTPLVTWALKGNRTVLVPGQRVDRLAVSRDASGAVVAILEEVSRADSGRELTCAAVNSAGAAVARTRLVVLAAEQWPPPVIVLGPANQTLPLHAAASMACSASPAGTKLSWTKDGAPLQTSARVRVGDNGALHIQDLLAGDAGEYECVASSRSGRYSWRGWLRVADEGRPPQRAAEPSALPGAPSTPRVNGTHHSVTLSWQRDRKVGSSSLQGYQVEVLVDEDATHAATWRTAARLLPSTTYTFSELDPGRAYHFLVRAQNSHGLSPPSDLAGPIVQDETGRWVERGRGTPGATFVRDDEDIQDALDYAPAVRLTEVLVSSSTSVKVMWDVLDPEQVDGLSIYWRSEPEHPVDDRPLQTLTVLQSGAGAGPPSVGFLVTGLRCFTVYEFFLVPFNHDGEGRPSNSARNRTLAAAPSAPPTKLEATLINGSTALVKWEPPPASFQNGPLQSYQVVVQAGNELVSNVTLSEKSALQLLLSNLSQHSAYHVSVAAATAAGLGPFSAPLTVHPSAPLHNRRGADANESGAVGSGELLTETWFMALLGSMVAVMVLLFSAIIFLHRRQHRANKETFLGFYDCGANGPVLATPLTLKAAEGMPHPLSAPLSPPLCLVPQDTYGAKYRGVSPGQPVDDLVLPEYAEANDAQYDGTSQGSTSSKSYYAEVRNPHLLSTFQSSSQLGSQGSQGSQGTHRTDSSNAAPYATTTLVCSAGTTGWSRESERGPYSDVDARTGMGLRSAAPPSQCAGHYDNYNYGSHPGSPSPLDHRDAALSLQTRFPSSMSPGGTGTAGTIGRENRRLKLLRRQLGRPGHGKGLPPSGQSSQLQLLLRSSPSSSRSGSTQGAGSSGSPLGSPLGSPVASPGRSPARSPMGSPSTDLPGHRDRQHDEGDVFEALHAPGGRTASSRAPCRSGLRRDACDYNSGGGRRCGSSGSSSSSKSAKASVAYSGLRVL